MLKKSIVLLVIVILLSGCGFLPFGEKGESEETVEAQPTPTLDETVLDLPTPAPPPEIETGEEGVVSLLEGSPPPTPTLPAPEESGGAMAEIVRLPRYNTARFSFEPAAGWEVIDLGNDTLLIRLSGDDEVYSGIRSNSPYGYLRYAGGIAEGTPITDVLDEMQSRLAGVEVNEEVAMPIIDGLRGVGRFVEGRNEQTGFRAYLVVFPLQDGVVKGVFWGPQAGWAEVAPQLNVVLSSLRWSRL